MGIALFLLGYCKLYKVAQNGKYKFGKKNEIFKHINNLTNLLLRMRVNGFSGACWGV